MCMGGTLLWQIVVWFNQAVAGGLTETATQQERVAIAEDHHDAVAGLRELFDVRADIQVALVPRAEEIGPGLLVATPDPHELTIEVVALRDRGRLVERAQ